MTEGLISIGDGSSIEDDQVRRALKVNGKVGGDSCAVEYAGRREVATIRQSILSVPAAIISEFAAGEASREGP